MNTNMKTNMMITTITTPEDLHKRQMNIKAHFVWALAI